MAESAPKKMKTNDVATVRDDEDSKPSAISHHEFIHDGCLRIPKVDCTNESFFKYNSILTVRELICWALRTETKVRLAKIERRSGLTTNDDPEYSYSKTLDSNYLIDVYPENKDEKKMKSDLTKDGRDMYKFSRKAHPQLQLKNGEDLFNGLTPVTIETNQPDNNVDYESQDFDGKQVVPPTLLHFEIILEAYMGYSLSSSDSHPSYYHHPKSSMPRAAIMGGAIVATLTAYQDELVVSAFENSGITEGGELQINDTYRQRKSSLVKSLHLHFISKKDGKQGGLPLTDSKGNLVYKTAGYMRVLVKEQIPQTASKFSDGDVDVFLQASPWTQNIISGLHEFTNEPSLISHINSYIALNTGLSSEELGSYTQDVINNAVSTPSSIKGDESSLAFTVGKTAISFLCGKEYEDDTFGSEFWPRTSQFIMLDTQADLLGGLLDFDISVAACCYDGLSVRVAPRAALSLLTNALFITPFCFEEFRNKSRVTKYARRGFRPFLVDPHDNTEVQNVACDSTVFRGVIAPRSTNVNGRGDYLNDPNNIEILRLQEESGGPQAGTFCCHVFTDGWGGLDLGHDARNTYRYMGIKYSQRLFETHTDDALDFYSNRFEWSDDDNQRVRQICPHLRMACRRCKHEYLLVRVVMREFPNLMNEYELEEDNLRGGFSYTQQRHFQPSFYASGAFDSNRARDTARRTVENVAILRAQSIFELGSYVLRHGSPEGYKKRFVFGDDLSETLEKANRTPLQEPKRQPIGLNPERFVDRCTGCKKWLLGKRYGTKECEQCNSNGRVP